MHLLLMLSLTCNLTLGELVFPWAHSITIESSWQKLTDTCDVELPRKVYYKDIKNKSLKDFINVGDAVSISLGYNERNTELFTGFIRQINPVVPVKVSCEDAMWSLKQNNVTGDFDNATLLDIVKHVAPGMEYNVLDAQIGKYCIPEDWSAAKVFEDLKSSYGLYSFIREGKLQVGLQYDPDYARTIEWELGRYALNENLEYFNKENLKLKVKAISIGKDNKKTTYEFGDNGGEERTMHFYNLAESELKAAAERELNRLKYDGYRGDFTMFGMPVVRHGDKVKLTDALYEERSGTYWVDKVVTKWNTSEGYTQIVTLGPVV